MFVKYKTNSRYFFTDESFLLVQRFLRRLKIKSKKEK